MRIFATLLLAACSACATAPPTTPARVTDAHVAALERGDRGRAWELLTPQARDSGVALPELPEAAPPPGARELSREARWTGAGGQTLLLRRDASGWRIVRGVLGLDRATTPTAALRAFARAITTRDYALWLRLLPASERRHWTAETLAAAVDAPGVRERWVALAEAIIRTEAAEAWVDDELRVDTPDGSVLLVEEEDGWKIRDVRPWPLPEPAEPTSGASSGASSSSFSCPSCRTRRPEG